MGVQEIEEWGGDIVRNATRKGLCVECQDDCDCGVNQFCGVDPEAPKTIPAFALDEEIQTKYPFLSAWVNILSSGVTGMAIKSKCLEYEAEGKRCKRPGDRAARIIHASSLEHGSYVRSNVYSPFKVVEDQRYPSQGDASDFCGKIDLWAPSRREWTGSGLPKNTVFEEDDNALVGSMQGTPASCTKQVFERIPGVDECSYIGNYFTVPSISCDQSYSPSETFGTCLKACTPPSASDLPYTNCGAAGSGNLGNDQENFCTCLKDCNLCVKRNDGCSADTAESDGHCGQCPETVQDTPPEEDPTSASKFVCTSSPDSEPSQTATAIPCKSACRKCLAAAMKTSCNCKDQSGTFFNDASFGFCLVDGQFEIPLRKGSSEMWSSLSYAWYRQNWQTEVPLNSDLVKVNFSSPAVAWEGICENSRCKVCNDFDESGQQQVRCSHKGIRQICSRGKWVRQEIPYASMAPELPGLPTDTAPVVICFLITGIVAFLVIIMTSVLWCITAARKATAQPVPPNPSEPASAPAYLSAAPPVAMMNPMEAMGPTGQDRA